MDFRILGPLEVRDDDGAPVPLTAPMLRATLATLLLRAGQVTPVELVAERLWGAAAPPTARVTAQNYVKRLRRALGQDRIATRPGGYQLLARPDEIDLARFTALRDRARREARHHPAAAADRLDAALALWRDGALEDVGDCPLRAVELPALQELRLAAMRERFELCLRLGRHGAVLEELGRAARAHPAHEVFTGQWMLALHRDGRTAQALQAYRETRRLLLRELGVAPGPGLRALEEAIRRGDPGLAAPAHSPAPVRAPHRPRVGGGRGAGAVRGGRCRAASGAGPPR
ncbi:hypothetical protein GCM10027168_25700 [Streptomyces capparidis]